jgi:hypothetical protein
VRGTILAHTLLGRSWSGKQTQIVT